MKAIYDLIHAFESKPVLCQQKEGKILNGR